MKIYGKQLNITQHIFLHRLKLLAQSKSKVCRFYGDFYYAGDNRGISCNISHFYDGFWNNLLENGIVKEFYAHFIREVTKYCTVLAVIHACVVFYAFFMFSLACLLVHCCFVLYICFCVRIVCSILPMIIKLQQYLLQSFPNNVLYLIIYSFDWERCVYHILRMIPPA